MSINQKNPFWKLQINTQHLTVSVVFRGYCKLEIRMRAALVVPKCYTKHNNIGLSCGYVGALRWYVAAANYSRWHMSLQLCIMSENLQTNLSCLFLFHICPIPTKLSYPPFQTRCKLGLCWSIVHLEPRSNSSDKAMADTTSPDLQKGQASSEPCVSLCLSLSLLLFISFFFFFCLGFASFNY